jgi:Flp pilus assembly protein TadB
MVFRRSREQEVPSITHAKRAHSDELDQRISRYLMSMAIRTVCIVLVVVVHHPVRWAFAVGAVVLPYVAVVIANAGYTRRTIALLPPSTPKAPDSLAAPKPTPLP